MFLVRIPRLSKPPTFRCNFFFSLYFSYFIHIYIYFTPILSIPHMLILIFIIIPEAQVDPWIQIDLGREFDVKMLLIWPIQMSTTPAANRKARRPF